MIIGDFFLDSSGTVLTDSQNKPLLATPLTGLPEPYGFSNDATWIETFNMGQSLAFAQYNPTNQTLQVGYIDGSVVFLRDVPPNIRTMLFLIQNPEFYILQIISFYPVYETAT